MKLTYLNTASIATLLLFAGAAHAETFNIPSGDLKSALDAYARQTGENLIVAGAEVNGVQTKGAQGDFSTDGALSRILSGTGFSMHRRASGAIGIMRDQSSYLEPIEPTPLQLAQAASPRASVETVTVTSSKLGGADVQSVPIAITAMSQEQLTATQTAGGPDLVKQVPNLTFTKTNFTGYSISIRGIGTQAVSVTTDPAVAVSFNDIPFIRNHFFEQEFFDVGQVEVLRGPQGTLYGRNATAGVVNIVSAKPSDRYEAMASVDVGNYENRRMEGMLNIPIIDDRLDLRAAGEWTKRNGYAFNATTKNSVDGRDLWSSRVTVGFKPVERLQVYAVWEHFSEDDDRARSTKQLCHHDSGPSSLTDGTDTVDDIEELARGYLSQGCKPGSLYDAGAFGTPNGLSIPFIQTAADPTGDRIGTYVDQYNTSTAATPVMSHADPYGNMMQSPDLRVINSVLDPKYRAKADVFELNADFDVTPQLTLTSQTGYNKDALYSFEDFNRFNTVPIFADSSKLDDTYDQTYYPYAGMKNLTPGGVFCDPQIGCSKSIAGFDISQEHSAQFNQEIRLASNFAGPLNFSAGANYTRYRTFEDYYVLFNLITLLAESTGPLSTLNVSSDPTKCTPRYPGVFVAADTSQMPVSFDDPASAGCVYIDPNPVDKINGQGHNYFRSANPYTLHSWAGFGEVYYQVAPDLKLTAGLRYTDDNKTFTPIPSQVLLSSEFLLGGTVDRGYPALPDIKQHWGEFTGRFVANWTPKLDFTDQTMFYASYSRGYKGGGANPPGIGYDPEPIGDKLIGPGFCDGAAPDTPLCRPLAQTLPYPKVFNPEFVNAYEAGSKNTLLDGSIMLNGNVFYYDYKDYQVSQIKSRTAVNENFDAKVWGAELESTYEPLPGLRFNFAGGYEGSRIAKGMQSIDLMDRVAGHAGYVLVRPFIQLPDSCVVPVSAVVQQIVYNRTTTFDGSNANDYDNLPTMCGAYLGTPMNPHNGPNGGAGFYKDLGGNELPNAPHFTISFGAQYSVPLSADWAGTLRGDFYAQTSSWARVYNDDPYDRLHGYTNMNFSLTFTNQDGWQAMAYVKNVLDTTAITGAFLNSDDTALTTNVFVTDPRLFGIRITKNW